MLRSAAPPRSNVLKATTPTTIKAAPIAADGHTIEYTYADHSAYWNTNPLCYFDHYAISGSDFRYRVRAR